MLDHVSLTVVDLERAERSDADHPERSYFSVRLGPVPDDAPRRHYCFKAPSRAAVQAFWRAGLAHGGLDLGAPGLRDYHANYYAAFLFDPDGNRIEAVCHRADAD